MTAAVTIADDVGRAKLSRHASAPEYHTREIGVASKSALDRIHKTPSKYLAWAMGKEIDDDEETDALFIGKAVPTARCSSPTPFRAHAYVVVPDFGDLRFKEAKASREAARRLDNAGKIEPVAQRLTRR